MINLITIKVIDFEYIINFWISLVDIQLTIKTRIEISDTLKIDQDFSDQGKKIHYLVTKVVTIDDHLVTIEWP